MPSRLRILDPNHRIGSYLLSTTRSFIGMIALSVMRICSGQTSVQHFVMLHIPRPCSSCAVRLRFRNRSSGCISSSAIRIKNLGPAKDFLFSSWSRITWQVSWQRKHSIHLRNSWLRSTSICAIRASPGFNSVGCSYAGISIAFL
ncbi:unannotated protein [freshwater metagenome]|uniref:Unannotated protein n=1 Tax=freshwater metagenome TaxID=449393 RepID=A0A6J7JL19_9ZZZZ